jgi:hypothetical protein
LAYRKQHGFVSLFSSAAVEETVLRGGLGANAIEETEAHILLSQYNT